MQFFSKPTSNAFVRIITEKRDTLILLTYRNLRNGLIQSNSLFFRDTAAVKTIDSSIAMRILAYWARNVEYINPPLQALSAIAGFLSELEMSREKCSSSEPPTLPCFESPSPRVRIFLSLSLECSSGAMLRLISVHLTQFFFTSTLIG